MHGNILPLIEISSLPLNFGSFTKSISGASDALSRAPENQEKGHQEKHQVPVKRRATRLKKGDDNGLI
jgi:hypothetical protein